MKGNTVALALIMCIAALAAMSATAYASDFATFQNDNYHTGITTDKAPTATPTANWSVKVGSGWVGFDAAPVVGGNMVFEVYHNGSVWAFNKTTGAVVWCNTSIGGDGSFELATPVYNDGVLYVALSKGNASTTTGIHAFWTANGTVKWTTPNIGDEQTNTPVIYDNGNVYFGTVNMTGVYASDKGTYYCYNASNGSRVWRRNTTSGGGYYWAGAAVIGNYLVYGDDKSVLVSVNKTTNETIQSINVSTTYGVAAKEIRSSISYNASTGRIYFTSKGGYCFALGFYSNGTFNTSNKWSRNLNAESTSTPAVYDGKAYVGQSPDGNYGFKILRESDGAVLYRVSTTNQVQASPVLSVNTSTGACYAYFTTNMGSSTEAGTIYCVNSTGGVVWKLKPTGCTYTLQGVAISDGYLYFGNDYSYIYGMHA